MKKLTITLAIMTMAILAAVAFAGLPSADTAPMTCGMHGRAGHDAAAADTHCAKPQVAATACHQTAATEETKTGAMCEHMKAAAASCHGTEAPVAEKAPAHAMGCCKS